MKTTHTQLKSNAQVEALPHLDKQYVRSAGGGLQLVVGPKRKDGKGTKTWRCEYKVDGKIRTAPFGEFPALSLKDARTKREAFRANPDALNVADKTTQQASDDQTFRVTFCAWHADLTARKWSETYSREVMQRAKAHLFPMLGDKRMGDITRADCVAVINSTIREAHGDSKKRGRKTGSVHSANHVRQHLELFFADWLDERDDETTRNPADRLAKKTKSHDKPKKQPAISTEAKSPSGRIEKAREVLAAVENSDASITMKLMHRMLALTALRPGEVLGMRWCEVDGNVWTIPEERMKGKRGQKEEHTVYLSDQAMELLDVARALKAPDAVYVFPSPRRFYKGKRHDQPIWHSSLSKLISDRLGARRHVPHGWRACFSTIMNAMVRGHRDVIDAMIAHKGQQVSSSEGHYRRVAITDFAEPATRIAAQWASMLLEGAPSPWTLAGRQAPTTNVVNFPKKHAA